MSALQTFEASLRHAVRERQAATVGGGHFTHQELEEVLSEIEALRNAKAQLEAMAAGQEPVAWIRGSGIEMLKLENGGCATVYASEGMSNQSSPLYAAPVAQQPQDRPDFTDEWTGYLKDGETPFERFLRERKDMQSVLKLYQRVLEENERLKAQQPQAEAVPWDRLPGHLIDKYEGEVLTEELLQTAVFEVLQAAPQQAEAVPPGFKHVCYLRVDPETKNYEVDHCEHPLSELTPAYIKVAAIAQQKG